MPLHDVIVRCRHAHRLPSLGVHRACEGDRQADSCLGFGSDAGQHCGCAVLSFRLKYADKLMQRLPHLAVACRSVGSSQRCILTTCASGRYHHRIRLRPHRGCRQRLCPWHETVCRIAKPAFTPAVLLETSASRIVCRNRNRPRQRKRLIS